MYKIELDSGREFCLCGSLMKCEREFLHNTEDSLGYNIEVFKVFLCLTCNEITIIFYIAWVSEGEEYRYENNPEAKAEAELYRKYTRRVLHAPKIGLHPSIPEPIAEVIYDAQSVLGKSSRASFILCRAVIEEICNDFNIPSSKTNNKGELYFISLANRLKLLIQKEKISNELSEIIDGIKELGNEGAHSGHVIFSERVENGDAENLLKLVNYIVERLYVDKYRQEEAKKGLDQLKNKILPPQGI